MPERSTEPAFSDMAFVIDMWDGDDRAVALAEGLDRERTQQKLSSVTVFELYTGVGRSSKPETEREKVLAVLDSKQLFRRPRPS